ncbi:hypothetical protein [Steroidobacter cummioxidans]|uniref:hypothetical protein n=1 Tax=Steroidobacter cummioxidans TaxID=1803913 RepID=UPI000E313632|nr:hypothetical protein [Steroidobacter cummioxidans]
MYYCIVILVAVAILQFVYESIIAPSLRLELRFELFKLRDEVRLLKIDSSGAGNGVEFAELHFYELQDSINSLISLLFRFDLATVSAISAEIERDAELKRRVVERSRILDDCALPEILAIRGEQFRIATKALVVNSGPVLIWLVLPALLFVGYRALRNKVKDSLTVPETDLKRLLREQSPMEVGMSA